MYNGLSTRGNVSDSTSAWVMGRTGFVRSRDAVASRGAEIDRRFWKHGFVRFSRRFLNYKAVPTTSEMYVRRSVSVTDRNTRVCRGSTALLRGFESRTSGSTRRPTRAFQSKSRRTRLGSMNITPSLSARSRRAITSRLI
jgi:hypothetical protein